MLFLRQARRVLLAALPLSLLATPALGRQDWAMAPGGIAKTPESNNASDNGCGNGSFEDIMRRLQSLVEGDDDRPLDNGDKTPARDNQCSDKQSGGGGGGGRSDSGDPSPRNGYDGMFGSMSDDPEFMKKLLDDLLKRVRDRVLDTDDGEHNWACPSFALDGEALKQFKKLITQAVGDDQTPGTDDACEKLGLAKAVLDVCRIKLSGLQVVGEASYGCWGEDSLNRTNDPPVKAFRRVWLGVRPNPDSVVASLSTCSKCPPGELKTELNGVQAAMSLGADDAGALGYLLVRSDTLIGGNGYIFSSILANQGSMYPPVAGPGAANLSTRRDIEVELNRGNADAEELRDQVGDMLAIRQLRVQDLYVDFVDTPGSSSHNYVIRFYKGGVYQKVNGLYVFPESAVPYREVTAKYAYGITATPGNANLYLATGTFALTDQVSGGTAKLASFKQSFNIECPESQDDWWIAGNETWELSRGNVGSSPEVRYEIKNGAESSVTPVLTTKTSSIYGQSGNLLHREKTWYRAFPEWPTGQGIAWRNGWLSISPIDERPQFLPDLEAVQHSVDPDGANLTSTWEYETIPGIPNEINFQPGRHRLVGQTSPSGMWEEYEYDDIGWLTKKTSRYLDHTTGAANNRVEEFGRRTNIALFSASGGDAVAEEITWRIEKVLDQEVSRSYSIRWNSAPQLDGSGNPIPMPDDETEIRCGPDASARLDPSGTGLKAWLESVLTDPFATPHLVSHERSISRDEMTNKELRGRLDVKLDADGTVTKFYYRSYPLASGSTAPTLANYGVVSTTPTTSAEVIRRVRGPAALSGCFPLKPGANLLPRDGEVSLAVTGPNNQTLLSESRDLQGSLGTNGSRTDYPWTDTLLTQRMTVTAWTADDYGRPTAYVSLDGSTETQAYYDCCGTGTSTDSLGLIHYTEKDSFGRVILTKSAVGTPAQQSTLYQYDALDRVIKTTRLGSNDSPIVQSETGYDIVGREAWTKDQLGNTTSFAYSLTSTAITTTTTMPDPDSAGPLAAPVSVDVAYPDGHGKESSGTAVHASRMEYGVETDAALAGGTPVLFTKSIQLGDGSPANTDSWSKTYTDSLGRGYRSTSPAADGTITILESRSTFGTRGRLLASIDPSGVKTLRLEGHGPEEAPASSGTTDWAGDWTIQALDVNGNGDIDFGVTATDRIGRSRSFTTQRTDGSVVSTVHRSVSDVWDSSGTPYVITTSTSDSSVDGRKSWSASFGVLTCSRSSDDAPTNTSLQISVSPDGNESVSISQYGRPISSSSYVGTAASGTLQAMVTYTYDAHGRQIKVTDTRATPADTSDDRETITTYDNADRTLTVTSPPAEVGQPSTVVTSTYDALGRVTRTEAQTGGVETRITTNTDYYPTGEASKTWGGESYPVEYTYDAVGQMKTLKTRQKSRDLDDAISQVVSDSTAAVTTWNYDSKTGLLLQKLYPHATTAGATGVGPSYTYYADGKLKRRTWARGAYADYTYSAATGELLSVTYSDGTPTVTYEYDRRGRVKSLIDASGTRSFEYDVSDQPKVEQYTAGILNGLKTAISYDPKLRRSTYSLTMGTGANNTRAYNVLGYDSLSRLSTVTRGSFVTTYTYKPHSNLLSGLQHTAGATTTGSAAYTHDDLDRIKSLTWTMNPGGTPTTDAFSYRYDAKGHRDRATDPDGSYWKFQYDTLGQVTSGRRYMPAGVAQSEDDDLDVPGYRFGYSFDHIGNRTATTATDGVPSFSTLPRLASYSANLLNQYTERTVPRVLDIAGYAPGTVTVDSQAVWRSGLAAPYDQYYWFPKEWPSVNSAFAAGVTVSNLAQPLNVFVPATPEQFAYDADGNLTQDGRWNYSWDGENRLTAMEVREELKPLFAQPLRLQFSYDSQHRRVRKVVLVPNPPGGSGGTGNATSGGNGGNIEENPEVLTPSGMTGIDEGATEIEPGTELAATINVGWTVITDIRFAWDGWLLSAELNNSGGLIRGYCWGIDLSGSRGGAAGVGGLLYTQDGGNALTNSNLRYVTSDSRGDVRAVYDRFGTLQARFEYGPFGEPTAVAGSASSSFPIRFSSKYADQETGLSFCGYRYISPSAGRWLSRDVTEEADGPNIFAFCRNSPTAFVDPLGLWRRGYWNSARAPVTSECNDSLEELAEFITGHGFYATSLETNLTEKEGQVVDVRPLIDILEQNVRQSVVSAAGRFRSDFALQTGPRSSMSEAEVRAHFVPGRAADCNTAAVAVLAMGMIDNLRDGEFARIFGSTGSIVAGSGLFERRNAPTVADLRPGDQAYFENDGRYAGLHKDGALRGVNAIAIGANMLWAHNSGNMTEASVNRMLVDGFNKGIPAAKRIRTVPGFNKLAAFFMMDKVAEKIFDARKQKAQK